MVHNVILPAPPSCLTDPDLGEHGYVKTASQVKFHYVAKGDPDKPLMLCLHGFPEVSKIFFCYLPFWSPQYCMRAFLLEPVFFWQLSITTLRGVMVF